MVDYQMRVNVLEKCYDSQKELANSLGVTPRSIRRYKTGRRTPAQSIRDKINSRWSHFKERRGVGRLIKMEKVMEDGTKQTFWSKKGGFSEFEALEDVKQEQQEWAETYSQTKPNVKQFNIVGHKIRTKKFPEGKL